MSALSLVDAVKLARRGCDVVISLRLPSEAAASVLIDELQEKANRGETWCDVHGDAGSTLHVGQGYPESLQADLKETWDRGSNR